MQHEGLLALPTPPARSFAARSEVGSVAQRTLSALSRAQRQVELTDLAAKMDNLAAWQGFMKFHVFAVWDFMSLLKRLQHEFSSMQIPWRPSRHPAAARLIHEIVLAEESDADGQGGHCSHFELYCRAMGQAGADDGPILRLLAALDGGASVSEALGAAEVPTAVSRFVDFTLHTAMHGSICEVASSFLFGRESMLPALFLQLVARVQQDEPRLSQLQHYLQRHIDVDGDEHGPAATRILTQLCGDDAQKWDQAKCAALQSLSLRRELWQFIARQVS